MSLGRSFIAVALLFAAGIGVRGRVEHRTPSSFEALRAAANEAPSFEDRFDAEVWLADMSSRLERQVKDPEQRLHLLKLVHLEATRADLAPELDPGRH